MELADFDLREPQQTLEPPVIAIMGFKNLSQRKVLGFASRLATESNQTQDAEAGLRDNHITGIFLQLIPRGLISSGAFAVDQKADDLDLPRFPFCQRPVALFGEMK